MAEPDEVLAENLIETLRQIQRYTVWGIGSSLSYFFLATTDLESTRVGVPVPGSLVEVNTGFAKVVALAIYWVVGAMASYALDRAKHIKELMQHKPGLLRATLTFPSIATEVYPLVRVLAALIPAGLVLIGLVFDVWLPADNGEWEWPGFATLMLMVPYITFAIGLTSGSLPVEEPRPYKSKD